MKRRANPNSFTPPGWRTITPRLFAADPKALCAFLKKVFKAAGRYSANRPTVLTIGDSMLMISGTEVRKPASGVFYIYVRDVDATYRRAIAAGGKSLEEPFDTPYGDRRGIVKDRWGNTWQIGIIKKP
jgi:PhnB protein